MYFLLIIGSISVSFFVLLSNLSALLFAATFLKIDN